MRKSNSGGDSILVWIILIIVVVMCNRQANDLGYRDDKGTGQVEYEQIDMYDTHDSLMYHYEK